MRDIATHIIDIVENAVTAEAKILHIHIINSGVGHTYTLLITDNGNGMDDDTLAKATDPYFTSRKTRKIGMGLPLLKQNAERTGGQFSVKSTPGSGTQVAATFIKNHLDCIPEGDIADAVTFLMISHPHTVLHFGYQMDKKHYHITSAEISQILGETPISNPLIRTFITDMIKENINKVKKCSTDN